MARVKQGRRIGGVYKVGQWWYARWTINGVKKTAPTHCTRREDAEKELAKLTHVDKFDSDIEKLRYVKDQIAARITSEDVYQREQNKVEWPDLIDKVLTVKGFPLTRLSNSSQTYYKDLGYLVKWMAEKHKYLTHIGTVTDDIAREFSAYIRAERGDCVHNACIKTLRAAWNSLKDECRLIDNPWKKIKFVQYYSTPTESLTDEDAEKIKAECAKDLDYQVMWTLSSCYSMRLSDSCLRKWSDISPDGKTLSFIPHKIRRHGEKARITVPMCRELEQVLQKVPKTESPYILPEMAESYLARPRSVEARVIRLIKRTGINGNQGGRKNKGWHSIRVWSISRMLQHAPLATVQSIAGHLQASQTQHYYRGDMDKTRKAIEAMQTDSPVVKCRPASSVDMARVSRGESVIIPKAEHDRLLEIERKYNELLQTRGGIVYNGRQRAVGAYCVKKEELK